MKDGSSVEITVAEQLWSLAYLLHVAVAVLLLASNGGLLSLVGMEFAAYGLVVLAVSLFLLLFARYPWRDLRGATNKNSGYNDTVVRRLFMLHDVTLLILSTTLLCMIFSGGRAHNGLPSARCWMATWEMALCGALISLWCLYVSCRASGALIGISASCVPGIRSGRDLVDEVRMRVEECMATDVDVRYDEVDFRTGR
ncbi:MAG: hypothetical protein ACTJLK_01810 [Anaplasma sp.]